MIHIITPCIRPGNLQRISSSIPKECNWIIILDELCKEVCEVDNATVITPEKRDKDHYNEHYNNSNWNRNYVLDNYEFKDGDWIHFLDDDNSIHPKKKVMNTINGQPDTMDETKILDPRLRNGDFLSVELVENDYWKNNKHRYPEDEHWKHAPLYLANKDGDYVFSPGTGMEIMLYGTIEGTELPIIMPFKGSVVGGFNSWVESRARDDGHSVKKIYNMVGLGTSRL